MYVHVRAHMHAQVCDMTNYGVPNTHRVSCAVNLLIWCPVVKRLIPTLIMPTCIHNIVLPPVVMYMYR